MDCGTTYATTSFAWLPEYSGKNQDEIIEAAGERACTVCYPNAPVSVLNRPTQMFTAEERKNAAERETRAKAAARKKAVAEKKKADDSIVIPGSDITSARKAKAESTDKLVNMFSEEYNGWLVENDPDNSWFDKEWEDTQRAQTAAEFRTLLPALAEHNGISNAEMFEVLMKGARTKYKKMRTNPGPMGFGEFSPSGNYEGVIRARFTDILTD